MSKRAPLIALGLGLGLGLGPVLACMPGCFAVANLDRFRPGVDDAGSIDDGGVTDAPATEAEAAGGDAADDPSLPSSLELTLRGMGVHLNQLIEFWIIDNANQIQMHGVVQPLDQPSSQSLTINVPGGIPLGNAPYRFDWFADNNNSGGYDGLNTGLTHDHAWRMAPLVDFPAGKFPHVPNLVQIVWDHNRVFTEINEWPQGTVNPPKGTGIDALVNFSGAKMSPWTGRLVQVRVVQARTHQTVGLFRRPGMPATDFSGLVTGILEAGEQYNVDVYVDANGNGTYENPSGVGSSLDLGWRFPVTASSIPDGGAGDAAAADAGGGLVGIRLDFDPQSAPGIIDVGEP
jgi:hypothetical protein